MTNPIRILFQHNIPRWIIFFIDVVICFFSLILAYLVRFNFSIPDTAIVDFPLVFGIVLGVRALSFFFSKTYKGIVKHTSSKDSQRIFIVITIGSIFYVLVNLLFYFGINKTFPIPFSIIIIDYMSTLFLMIILRVVFKALYTEIVNPYREKRNVIIFGAGESGIITKRTLDRDAGLKYKVLAFIDDDHKKEGKILEGIPIVSFKKLDDLLSKNDVAQVVISVQNISPERKKNLVDICLNYDTKVLNVPPVTDWINGELSFKQIKKIQIEELLERDPIQLNIENIKNQLSNKTILVTGAAGSIGSEIVRQIINFNPKKIILLDQAESPLYDMEMELNDDHNKVSYEIVIGDIRNTERLENLFRTFQPEIVFHAAAYKHVPMMENNPSESILTNVFGTKNCADLSVKYKVEKFVMVSTDKAVNPTNVMGASKRIAEIYTQSLSKTSTTKFITTRFGNVLGSNGSVIPRFRQQIENGGPVTITHPDITRFFMTIPEACQLVLEAGTSGHGGEIFIFDMGESVKILDLAKKMIKLSGLTLDKDIKITFTGLRPGEKLYEELLANEENTLPTHHKQILIAKVKEYDFEEINTKINELIASFESQDNKIIVKQMKLLVPEFKSNNSIYEQLD
ncbi:MAG: polysaccharide biosynthesis protein [Flavobacteriales bacterium]|nr:polysaccharide biosynthesis protein [Flavobacteriales bacterium]MCB9173411.1 polysaccharide biosynthesis protein [Flavobacteriales bacterium]